MNFLNFIFGKCFNKGNPSENKFLFGSEKSSILCWDLMMIHILIDSKSIEDEIIHSQSRPLSERDGSDIDFINRMDSDLDYP